MSKRTLLYYGHPLLRQKAELIEEITDEIRTLAEDLTRMCFENNAAGIAAPQIGVSLRMFISCYGNEGEAPAIVPPKVFINPHIEWISDEMAVAEEGCISIPHIYERIERPVKIRIQALGIDGEVFIEEATLWRARNLLHENDHLNGVLIVDRTSPLRRSQLAPQLKKIKKKYNG